MSEQPGLELIQFLYSPYNEKARWALDWKGIPHTRRSLLPGPHAPTMLRLTRKTQTPALRDRATGEVVAGSDHILAELERRFPEPALLPADPEKRERALELERFFDEEVGPCVRRALFGSLLRTPGYMARMFSEGRGRAARLAYRTAFPLVVPVMRRDMDVYPEPVEEAAIKIREGLDFVAKHAGNDGHLVGDSFSLADLTAASMLAPLCDPDHPAMKRPEPRPEPFTRFLVEWSRHPGVAWVYEMYRRHRPDSCETGAAGAA